MRRVLTTLALTAVLVSTSAAQEPETRTAEHARAQRAKASSLEPPTPHRLEKWLLDIERAGGFGVPRGFYVTFGDIKSGSAFALGPAYGKMLDDGTIVHLKGAYSVRNFKMAQATLQARPVLGRRLTLDGRLRWQDAPTLAVYPIGTRSIKTRFDYSETRTEVSARALFRPVRPVWFSGGVSYENYDTTEVALDDPPADGTSGRLAAPGSGADPAYVHTHLSGALDSRDGPGFSRRGSLLQATIHDYRQQAGGGGLSFRRVDARAEQYVPILRGNWVLFFGARASTTSTSGANLVPFFLMPQLGGRDLRGFSSYRFRDRHSILFTAEYRWYVQEFVDMAVFYDTGKVAATRSQLNADELRSSVGIGIRFHSFQATPLRVEVARSREGWRLIFGFNPVGGL